MRPTVQQHVPDILDCLAQLSNDEVPTPPKVARAMLGILPDEVWSQPDYKWLDPFCKSGIFLREIASRLLDGLSDQISDFDERRRHIYREMLWGTSITEMTGMISRRTLYYSHNGSSEHSVVRFDDPDGNLPFVHAKHDFSKKGGSCHCGAPVELERGRGRENYAYSFIHGCYPTKEISDMKFDVIVGNPPYQIDSDGNTRTMPVYHHFVKQAISMDPRYVLMITPARWFGGGLGLDEYRKQILNDRRMKRIVDYPSLFEVFPGVEIKGGVCYFLWDREHNDNCEVVTVRNGVPSKPAFRDISAYDVHIRANEAVPILEKVRAKGAVTLNTQVATRVPFGMQANFGDFKEKAFAGAVKIYGNKFVGYTHPSNVTKNVGWLNEWKLLVPKASDGHGRVPASVIPRPIVAAPYEACTDTYLVVGHSNSETEIRSLATYLVTKFARFLIHQRKPTQDNKPATFTFVPVVPFDRDWSDEMLYERYGFTDDEIAYIESQIKPMESVDA